jgi:hypothetical protein
VTDHRTDLRTVDVSDLKTTPIHPVGSSIQPSIPNPALAKVLS